MFKISQLGENRAYLAHEAIERARESILKARKVLADELHRLGLNDNSAEQVAKSALKEVP